MPSTVIPKRCTWLDTIRYKCNCTCICGMSIFFLNHVDSVFYFIDNYLHKYLCGYYINMHFPVKAVYFALIFYHPTKNMQLNVFDVGWIIYTSSQLLFPKHCPSIILFCHAFL